MNQENTFPFMGHQITVITAPAGVPDKVIIDKGTGPLFHFLLGTVHADKAGRTVVVDYDAFVTDQQSNMIPGTYQNLSFNATTQETFQYFFDPARTGPQECKMCINGLLTQLYGTPSDPNRQVTCFDFEGNFVAPADLPPAEPTPPSDGSTHGPVPGV